MNQKIAIAFFSATNVTRTYAECIQAELATLGSDPRLIDITPHTARQMRPAPDEYDGILFGFPVFADFPPSAVNDWFGSLEGGGKPCSWFATYGGRTTGYAHYHAWSLLSAAGFRVHSGAEFLGRHSFNLAGWRMLEDRPNGLDLGEARRFAAITLDSFSSGGGAGFSLPKPSGYDEAAEALRHKQRGPERSWAQPVRVKECGLCGLCEVNCPVQAMDHRAGESDPGVCIECMHCVYLCPEQALKADDRLAAFYPEFLAQWNLTDEILARKQSQIRTAAWEAAA